MKYNTLKVDFDSTGRRFVYQDIDECDRNHGIDRSDPANEAKMYENTSKYKEHKYKTANCIIMIKAA